jgi:hypothetical protein
MRSSDERCSAGNKSEFLVSSGIRKNSPDGSIHPDVLTKRFVNARSLSGLEFTANPPTFNGIRSLAGRLHEKEHGAKFEEKEGMAFGQRLPGHTSETTTEKSLDTRKKEFILV